MLFRLNYKSAEEGWFYLNSKGNSFPEAMLTIVILFIIAGGLIPVLMEMRIQLEDKKRSMHAAQTAYQAIVENNNFQSIRGELEIDGVVYSWMIEEERICVNYLSHEQLKKNVCIENT